MHYLYILYSKKKEKYYVGETADPEIRVLQHNSHYFKGSFTSIADDWKPTLILEFDTISQARKAELFIKKMKSRIFIEKLIIDSGWFLEKFKI